VFGSVGQVSDEEVEVFGSLLTVACASVGVLGIGEESRLRGCVTLTEIFGQSGVGVGVVALELGQEAFDGDGHELSSAEGGHMAEDVGGVEPLSGDVEVECVDEFGSDLIEDLGGEVVLAEELLIAFEGSRGESGAWFEVQGVLDVGSEDVGFDGVLSVPVEEVGEEDEAGHGIEFFGGSAEGVTEMLGELADRHDFEDDVSKDALPAAGDDLDACGRYDPLEGVKEAVLSGIDGMDHCVKLRLTRPWFSQFPVEMVRLGHHG
jgi:hypothetical protein